MENDDQELTICCQRGQVIYQKSYGYQNHDKTNLIRNLIVDTVLLQKMVSLPNIMQLYRQMP
jgi:hypothetical protein